MHSAKHRHQSPEWMILSHVNCCIQGEIVGFQVLLDSRHPRNTRVSCCLLQFSKGEAVKIFLASHDLLHLAFLSLREKRCGWTVTEGGGRCLVVLLTLSFCISWYHWINSLKPISIMVHWVSDMMLPMAPRMMQHDWWLIGDRRIRWTSLMILSLNITTLGLSVGWSQTCLILPIIVESYQLDKAFTQWCTV